jgi:hypothetical protein
MPLWLLLGIVAAIGAVLCVVHDFSEKQKEIADKRGEPKRRKCPRCLGSKCEPKGNFLVTGGPACKKCLGAGYIYTE